MSYAIPSLTRVPATEKGLTIADFLVPVRVGERVSPLLRNVVLVLAGALLIYLTARVSITIAGQPRAVHAPEPRRAARRRRAGPAARRARRVPVPGARASSACRSSPRAGAAIHVVLGRDRRLPGRVRARGGARRAARGARLGPADRRRDRRHAARARSSSTRSACRGWPSSTGMSAGDAIATGLLPFVLVDIVEAAGGRGRVPGRVVGGRAAARATADGAGLRAGPAGGPRRGLYGPGSEAWRLNREASLLLGAGPRALLLQVAHPAGRRGRRPALRLPRGPVGAARRHAAQLPADRLRDAGGGTGRDPAPERPPRRRDRAGPGRGRRRAVRRGLRGARPGPLPVGPRDARRLDAGRGGAWLEPLSARPPGPVLRRDAAGRAGCSGCRRIACRPTSTRSTRTSPRCSPRAGRSTRRRPRASWRP